MSLNNEHAARLREMADAKKTKASVWREQSTSLSPWSGFTHRQCHEEGLRCEREAAAFLAGAEALEAVEVAKTAMEGLVAALDQVHEDQYYQRVWNAHQLHCGPYRGKQYENELKQAHAALARLEGK
jgi:hypothetical protein